MNFMVSSFFLRIFYNSYNEKALKLYFMEVNNMSKMKKYFKDYGATIKVCNQFYKEHWLGTIVLSTAIIGIEFGVFYVIDHKDEIKDRIQKTFSRNKKVEIDF